MKRNKLKLNQFKVKSFVTTISNGKSILGGNEPTVTDCDSNDVTELDCDSDTTGTNETADTVTLPCTGNTNPLDRVTITGGGIG